MAFYCTNCTAETALGALRKVVSLKRETIGPRSVMFDSVRALVGGRRPPEKIEAFGNRNIFWLKRTLRYMSVLHLKRNEGRDTRYVSAINLGI